MSYQETNSAPLKLLDSSGKDVSPKRLTDDNYECIQREAELTVNEIGDMEWFSRKIHRFKKENELNPQLRKKDKSYEVEIVTEPTKKKSWNPETRKLYLKLSETSTIWLLSINSKYSRNDTDDINKVKADNDFYTKICLSHKYKCRIPLPVSGPLTAKASPLTTEKSLKRSQSVAETQTPHGVEKTRGTLTSEVVKVDSFVNASVWDLYDTYAKLGGNGTAVENDSWKSTDTSYIKSNVFDSTEAESKTSCETEMKNIFDMSNFKYALLVTERLLASNCYQNEQSVFKKFTKSKYDDSEQTSYKYEVRELWKYEGQAMSAVLPLSVTAMDWNPFNSDLLATGYGNVDARSDVFGMIRVWSPKNPLNPEREIRCKHSVTALSFSRIRPNVVAIGCCNGNIYTTDVSTENESLHLVDSKGINPRHGPIWKIQWFTTKGSNKMTEDLLAIGEDGILIKFTFPDNNETNDLTYLTYLSTVKTFFTRRGNGGCREIGRTSNTFMKHSFSGLWFSAATDRNLCYVSTKEGALIKAEAILSSCCKIVNTFTAHTGPIYSVEHSPFTDLVFLTSGADWCIRIWADDIIEPLITLKMQGPVMSAKWSTTIATLIGAVSATDFSLWDIAGSVFLPANSIHFEGDAFTNLIFSQSGKNVVLGDAGGSLRVIRLFELPRQPFLQKEALVSAIEKGLVYNEALLKKFKRLTSLQRGSLKTEIKL